MHLNTDHPDYDEALELLCTLPRLPSLAPLDVLDQDFPRMDHQALVSSIRAMRATHQLALAVRRLDEDPTRWGAAIHPLSWNRAKELAEDYWSRVHEHP